MVYDIVLPTLSLNDQAKQSFYSHHTWIRIAEWQEQEVGGGHKAIHDDATAAKAGDVLVVHRFRDNMQTLNLNCQWIVRWSSQWIKTI